MATPSPRMLFAGALLTYSGFIVDADGDGLGDSILGSNFVRSDGSGGFLVLRGGPAGWAGGNLTAVPVNVGTVGNNQINQVFP